MANETSVQTPPPPQQKLTAKSLFDQDNIKSKLQAMLGKKSTGFITSVLQIVASNKLLANADPMSIYQAACVAATLDLPLNNNLGFAYIIPYNEKRQDEQGRDYTIQVAQFQIGYKGFIQLAQRTGMYKKIGAAAIYEGQLIKNNPLTGCEFDFDKKLSDKVTGYAAYFSTINGFEATLYMTVDQLQAHGKKYSKTYNQTYGKWKTDFEAMATKTVIKLLLSKYGPLSVDIQTAMITDQSVVKDADTNEVEYVDHEDVANAQLPEAINIEDLTMLFDFKKDVLTEKELKDAERIINNKEEASYKKLHTLLQGK